jgi:hypothetical protein
LVPKFKAFATAHPDVSWTYGGFQEDGLYMNYPMIDQCRTENQCDGCSDPRFRGWYVTPRHTTSYRVMPVTSRRVIPRHSLTTVPGAPPAPLDNRTWSTARTCCVVMQVRRCGCRPQGCCAGD